MDLLRPWQAQACCCHRQLKFSDDQQIAVQVRSAGRRRQVFTVCRCLRPQTCKGKIRPFLNSARVIYITHWVSFFLRQKTVCAYDAGIMGYLVQQLGSYMNSDDEVFWYYLSVYVEEQ